MLVSENRVRRFLRGQADRHTCGSRYYEKIGNIL